MVVSSIRASIKLRNEPLGGGQAPRFLEQIAEVVDSDQATVDAAVARARETFDSGVWRKLPAAHRAEVLFRAADIIRARTDELAELARENAVVRSAVD